ncbi:hypothetical protein GCM10008983_10590 [Lentibacillus halophilus]|uniref:SGNH hydrolase-type esterase domain-containing protein n=2 Tax=Lentibacillus halophilus TaxID=295065 RepID=A0ABP3J2J5_9BACI
MNKKLITGILISVLILCTAVFFLISNPDEPVTQPSETNTDDHDQPLRKSQSESGNDKNDNESPEVEVEEKKEKDNNPDEKADESGSRLQELLNKAVRSTINFFTKEHMHVAAVGDSLTQGVGDDVVEGGYIGILDQKINQDEQRVTFDNFGKRGNRSSQLLKRLEKPSIQESIKQADIVLLTIGANDVMQVVKKNFLSLEMSDFKQPRKDYKTHLESIFTTIKNLNDDASIYLIGFYNPFRNYFKNLEELNTIINNWNQTGKTATSNFDRTNFIPIADMFHAEDKNVFAEDNFHPNHRGYQLFARRVLHSITTDQ